MMDSAMNFEASGLRSDFYEPLTATDPVTAAISHYQEAISHFSEDEVAMAAEEPARVIVPASFLDALISEFAPSRTDDASYISAVNSDEVGLYRMFRGYSP